MGACPGNSASSQHDGLAPNIGVSEGFCADFTLLVAVDEVSDDALDDDEERSPEKVSDDVALFGWETLELPVVCPASLRVGEAARLEFVDPMVSKLLLRAVELSVRLVIVVETSVAVAETEVKVASSSLGSPVALPLPFPVVVLWIEVEPTWVMGYSNQIGRGMPIALYEAKALYAVAESKAHEGPALESDEMVLVVVGTISQPVTGVQVVV